MLCRQCEIDKNDNEFPPKRRVCKSCVSNRHKEWSSKNKDKLRENQKKFREANRDLCRERVLKCYYKNPWKYREYKEKNREKCREYSRSYKERNREEVLERKREAEKRYRTTKVKENKARKAVYHAIKKEVLIKSDICMICGLSGKIEAHHKNYDKQLEVIWVCRLCHGGIHAMMNKNRIKENTVSNGSIKPPSQR